MITIYTKLELSYDGLGEIDSIKLTNRQVDVIACLISRHKRKFICRILDISLSTYIEHLRKIKEAINTSRKDKQVDLLEFLETSEVYQALKNHYAKLLIQHYFEKTLCDIFKHKFKSNKYYIKYSGVIDKNNLLNKKIRKHLRLAGIDFEIYNEQNEHSSSIIIHVCSTNYYLKYYSADSISIRQDVDSTVSAKNPEFSYYDSIFKFLSIVYGFSNIKEFQIDFNGKKIAYEKNLLNDTVFSLNNNINKYTSTNYKKIIKNDYIKDYLPYLNFFKKYKLYLTFILFSMFIYSSTSNIGLFLSKALRVTYIDLLERKVILNLPPRNKNFVERENVFRLVKKNFKKSSIGIMLQAIVGTGGIGKTQVAIEYAYRALEKNKYKAVLWVSAQSDVCINNSYSKFATKMKIDTNNLNDSQVINAVHSYLIDKFRYNNVLIILDNAPSRKIVEKYLRDLHNIWPIDLAPHVLITSRSQHWIEDIIFLDILSSVEAKKIVKKILPNSQDYLVKDLINALHHFPLALIQAAGYIKQHTNIEHYLKLYFSKKREYLDILPEGYNQYEDTVWRTLSVTIDRVGSTAKEILYLSSYLYPGDISLDLFEHLSIEQRSRAVQELRDHSLIVLNRNMESFRIHRILQEIIRLKIQEKSVWRNKLIQMANQVLVSNSKLTKQWIKHIIYMSGYLEIEKDLEFYTLLNKCGDFSYNLGMKELANELYLLAINSGNLYLD
ncbi:MAG: hypothetical protein HRT87_06520 [Legionellales bacterium]|nr:hypothetical protein [Legionellales bacterium]